MAVEARHPLLKPVRPFCCRRGSTAQCPQSRGPDAAALAVSQMRTGTSLYLWVLDQSFTKLRVLFGDDAQQRHLAALQLHSAKASTFASVEPSARRGES